MSRNLPPNLDAVHMHCLLSNPHIYEDVLLLMRNNEPIGKLKGYIYKQRAFDIHYIETYNIENCNADLDVDFENVIESLLEKIYIKYITITNIEELFEA